MTATANKSPFHSAGLSVGADTTDGSDSGSRDTCEQEISVVGVCACVCRECVGHKTECGEKRACGCKHGRQRLRLKGHLFVWVEVCGRKCVEQRACGC